MLFSKHMEWNNLQNVSIPITTMIRTTLGSIHNLKIYSQLIDALQLVRTKILHKFGLSLVEKKPSLKEQRNASFYYWFQIDEDDAVEDDIISSLYFYIHLGFDLLILNRIFSFVLIAVAFMTGLESSSHFPIIHSRHPHLSCLKIRWVIVSFLFLTQYNELYMHSFLTK